MPWCAAMLTWRAKVLASDDKVDHTIAIRFFANS